MSDLEINISYESLKHILYRECGELAFANLDQISVVKVIDIPSIIPENDRITIYLSGV